MAQHCFVSSPTRAPIACGPKRVERANGISTTAKRGVFFHKSVGVAPKENQHDEARWTMADTEGSGGGHDEKPWYTLGRSSLRRPSFESRLRHHVEHFINVSGGSMVEGRHLLQLLQVT